MTMYRGLFAILVLLLTGLAAARADAPCADCVTTGAGALRGVREDGVLAFKGVPYAAPPVGPLRFRPPQPAPRWAGVREAQRFSAPCTQTGENAGMFEMPPERFRNPLTGRASTAFGREDCLYLNVWTPAADAGRRPVMVFLHGGAFQVGTASSEVYSGRHVARRGVVFVTLNYRLGAFGFLELGRLDPAFAGSGNNGLRDQIAALQWVRRHAGAFGGDPDNITVLGESAGSMSVAALLATELPQRLFRRAIGQSGGPNLLHTRAFREQATRVFAAHGPKRSLAQWRSASTRALLEQQENAIQRDALGDSLFARFVDGDLLPGAPYERMAAGNAAQVDVMVGATQDEMGYWSRYDPQLRNLFVQPWSPAPGITAPPVPLIPSAVRQAVDQAMAAATPPLPGLDAVYTGWVRANDPPRGLRTEAQTVALTQGHDFMMILPMTRWAEQLLAHNPNTYLYRFQWQVPRKLLADPAQQLGAIHALELPFTFGSLDLAEGLVPGGSRVTADPVQRAEARRLSDMMVAAWVNFARSGDPNGEGVPAWPRYDLAARRTMVWGNDAEGRVSAGAVADLEPSRRRAWSGWGFPLYPWQPQ